MTLNLPPKLENELVLIRPLKEQDFEVLYSVAKDPLIWEQHPSKDRYKKSKFVSFFNDSIESKGALIIIDKSNKEVIGSSRYKKLDVDETAVEIGWSFLARKYWGGKYNRAVKILMIDYAFKIYNEIIFYVSNTNIRSKKAIEKIGGMQIFDSKYKSLSINNDLIYRINKPKWELITKEHIDI
ncbi:MAG: GNAT family N-acetyltransferase [Bacteroidales bacterium]